MARPEKTVLPGIYRSPRRLPSGDQRRCRSRTSELLSALSFRMALGARISGISKSPAAATLRKTSRIVGDTPSPHNFIRSVTASFALSGFDAPGDGGVDAAVDGIDEVLGREELADPLVGLVVGQQRPEQGLLGLLVRRRDA